MKKTHEKFMEDFKNKGKYNKIKVLGKYNGVYERIECQCVECSYVWNAVPHDLLCGNGCPSCSNKTLCVGFNDLATKRPDLVKYFVNKEESTQCKVGSGKRFDFKCQDCGKIVNMRVGDFTINGVRCGCTHMCKSFAERVVLNLLKSLNVDFDCEKIFDWSNKKRYDFYIPNLNCIIETHGIQHYKQNRRGLTLEKEQENDALKEVLAKENNIDDYVILDCRYSEIEWIKNSIVNSRLSEIFDLSNVNWEQVELKSLETSTKQICELWNEYENIRKVCEITKLSKPTILKNLKSGKEIGFCNYDAKIEKIKHDENLCKRIEVFKDGKSLGVYKSIIELQNSSIKDFGVYLSRGLIGDACSGKREEYKGYNFKKFID
ncbi:MAG: hypothetical protein ACRCTZ_09260 [Sarcina sp.]